MRSRSFWRNSLILIVAVSIIAPGAVEATVYGGGGGGVGNPTLTATGVSGGASAQCGLTTTESDQDNSGSSDYITSVTTTGATAFGVFYSAVQFNLVTDQQGSGGYEYLDGEFDIGCYNTPEAVATSISLAVTGSTSNVGWAVTAIESIPSTTTAPTTTYCSPGSVPSASESSPCGGGSGAESACGLSSPSYYLPNDWQSGTLADWYTKDITGGSSPCGTLTTFSPMGGITNTNTYIGTVSFAIGSASATSTPSSASWAISLTVSE